MFSRFSQPQSFIVVDEHRCKEAVTCADEYSIGIKYDARGRAAKADFEFDRVFPSSGEGSSQVRTSSAVGGCGDSGGTAAQGNCCTVSLLEQGLIFNLNPYCTFLAPCLTVGRFRGYQAVVSVSL